MCACVYNRGVPVTSLVAPGSFGPRGVRLRERKLTVKVSVVRGGCEH